MVSELNEGFGTLFAIAPLGIVALAPDGRIAQANPALAAMFGYAPDELSGQPLELLVPEALRANHAAHQDNFLATPHMRPMGIGLEVMGRRKDGQLFPIEAGLSYIQQAGQSIPVAFVVDITERKRLEQEHDQLLHQERAARVAAEVAQRRQLFLAEASRVLAASLDYETTLANLVQSAIPFLGDCCMVDLLVDDQVQRVAAMHSVPEKAALLHEIRQRYPLTLDTPHSLGTVLRTGQPVLHSEITEPMLARAATDAAHLRLMRGIGMTSAIFVPLCLRTRVLGVLSIVISESDRRYNSDDMALAQELALLAAQAINNAQLVRDAQAVSQQTEEALALLDTMVQSAPIGFAFLDHQLRYRLINIYLATLNGLPPAAHLGRTTGEIVPNAASQVAPLLQRVLDTGEPLIDMDFSAGRPTAPDQLQHWQCSFYPVRTHRGELLGVGVMVFDITVRKQTEAALRRYQLLAEHASDIFLFVQQDGRIIEANHAAVVAYGYDRATLLTKTIADLRDPATVDDLADKLQRARTGNILFETRHRRRDGTSFPIEVHARSTVINDERIILSIGRDISERKQAELALQESEERFRTTFEQAAVGIGHLAPTGQLLRVNRRLCDIIGYAREELLDRTLHDISTPDLVSVAQTNARQLLANEITISTSERQIMRKDGALIWINVTVSLVRDDTNEPAYFIAVVEDITERKQADETRVRLATLVDSSDDAIISQTLGGTILSWNAGAERIFGYSVAEIIGQSISVLIPNDRLDEEAQSIEKIRRGERIAPSESVRIRKDRQLINISLTILPLRDADGRIAGIWKIARDISVRKQAEQALRQQTMLVQLLQGVAVAANQAAAIEDALQVAIDQICDYVDWPVGHVYLAPVDGSHTLVSTNIWHMHEPERFAIFRSITEAVAPAALDDLPGRVLLTGRPEWITDITSTPNTARTKLISDIGVRAGFAFPVTIGAEVAAVLEFFATEPHQPDAALLDVMVNIGTQLGHVIARARGVALLSAAEAKYRILVEQLPAIIYIADSDSRNSTRYISPQIETILGFTPAEWLADPNLWLKQIHPDDQQRVLAEITQAYTNDGPVPTEYRSRNRDGRIVWLRDESKIVRDEEGRPLFMQGIMLDITERHHAEAALRRSELLYRTLARNFPNGAVFLFDHDLRYTIADGQGLAEQGYSRETFEGRTLYEVLPPQLVSIQEPLYRAALAGHESINESVAGERTFIAYYQPVRNEQGEIFAGMVMSHDITALKQAEQALVAERVLLSRRVTERTADLSSANAELARAARLKDEFLASMSHELRTPLNAVIGLTESLREQTYGPLSDRQDRPLSMIEESSRHLLTLINDILDLAKIGAGKMDLDIERVAVEAICQASLRMIRQTAQQKRIAIQMQLDPTATYVLADARRLIQILVNLLMNAVKFTPSGGTIGLEVQCNAEQQALRFTVWDTGIGIPTEQLARLFQPFVQLDSRLARQYEGTGLGLALVSRMTEMHGGSVAVSSTVGVGSRFTIALPWNAASAEHTPPVLPPPAKTTSIDIRRALIVEDSPTAADQVARFLAEMNITTETLTLGADTVARARATQPDLILLDILLPDISGWMVLTQLKADPVTQEIPVVISSVIDEQSRGLALGAVRHLVKPCTRREIQNMLRQLSGEPMPMLAEQGSEPPRHQPSILLAEDNEASILIVTDYLATLGYQVVVARNGVEAITRAHELQPGLILMDIQMPEMDGLEATRRMRADAELAAVPIIAMTALAMPGDRAMCLAAGANDYISKPISLKGLASLLAEHLQPAQQDNGQPVSP